MSNEAISHPRIIITAAEDVIGECWNDYSTCISNSNGVPIRIDLGTDIDTLEKFDGLLITAGVDIDPRIYGASKSDSVSYTHLTLPTKA